MLGIIQMEHIKLYTEISQYLNKYNKIFSAFLLYSVYIKITQHEILLKLQFCFYFQ